MRTVLAYLKPHRRYMCLSLTIKVLGTMVELALPYILSHIIQDVIKPMGAEVSPDLAAGSRRIVMWAVIMIICAFLGVLGNVTANRRAAHGEGCCACRASRPVRTHNASFARADRRIYRRKP